MSGLFLFAAFGYVIAAITRLGYFNLTSHGTGGFVGVPTTIVGLLWSSLFLAQPGPTATAAWLLLTAAAMVVPVSIPRPEGWRFLLFPGWAVALVVIHLLS